jgi:uncharacterized protein (DUF58 family)
MQFNLLTRKTSGTTPDQGVYTSLDSLLRVQARATGFSFLPRQPIHSILAGRHASRLRGRGLNFEEIRGYLPGDDTRNMDWKVTARMRKPHVRVFTEERDRPVLLVVDQRITMFFGSWRCMKSVTAAETAAFGAWRTLSVGDRVGAIVFNDTETVEIAPHRSRQRVVEILGKIVKLNRQLDVQTGIEANPSMFNEALQLACRTAKHDFLVCLITDGAGTDEETVRHVTRLSEHNDVLSLFVYDPLEKELPEAGRLVMAEGQQQLEIDTSDNRIRDRYRAAFRDRFHWFQTISRQREIPLLPISTAEDVGVQIKRHLGRIAG